MSTVSHLAASLGEMPQGMRRVADYIVQDPARAADLTIAELAEQCGSSPATINRLCHRLGFSGYQKLRVALATDSGRAEMTEWQQTVGTAVHPGDPLSKVAAVIANGDTRAIQETAARLDLPAVEAAADALIRARRIHLFGVGGSHMSAEDLRHRLNLIGLAVWSWADMHSGLAAAAMMKPDDVLVSFSHGGRTTETLEVQEHAARAGATTIALTNVRDSPLARHVDIPLITTVTEGPALRSEALAARHSQLFLVDLLYVAVVNRAHDRSLEAYDRASTAVGTRMVPDRRRKRD